MTVFVDTSAFIALLDEDDRWHTQAAQEFRWLAMNEALVTHNYVLLETLAVARRRLGPAAVHRLTDEILPLIRTIWIDELTHASALARHRMGGSPSLVDQVSFAVMRQNGIEVAFAFDRDFDLDGFKHPVLPPETRQVHETPTTYGGSWVDDPVSVSEIASRAGRSINTVQSWRRRHRDFPTPDAQLAAGPLWSWPAVAAWISRREGQPRASAAA